MPQHGEKCRVTSCIKSNVPWDYLLAGGSTRQLRLVYMNWRNTERAVQEEPIDLFLYFQLFPRVLWPSHLQPYRFYGITYRNLRCLRLQPLEYQSSPPLKKSSGPLLKEADEMGSIIL